MSDIYKSIPVIAERTILFLGMRHGSGGGAGAAARAEERAQTPTPRQTLWGDLRDMSNHPQIRYLP